MLAVKPFSSNTKPIPRSTSAMALSAHAQANSTAKTSGEPVAAKFHPRPPNGPPPKRTDANRSSLSCHSAPETIGARASSDGLAQKHADRTHSVGSASSAQTIVSPISKSAPPASSLLSSALAAQPRARALADSDATSPKPRPPTSPPPQAALATVAVSSVARTANTRAALPSVPPVAVPRVLPASAPSALSPLHASVEPSIPPPSARSPAPDSATAKQKAACSSSVVTAASAGVSVKIHTRQQSAESSKLSDGSGSGSGDFDEHRRMLCCVALFCAVVCVFECCCLQRWFTLWATL